MESRARLGRQRVQSRCSCWHDNVVCICTSCAALLEIDGRRSVLCFAKRGLITRWRLLTAQQWLLGMGRSSPCKRMK